MKYVRPAPNEEIVPASVAALRQYFGEDRVRVTHLSLTELADAIRRGEVDVFLSSAGFYRRLTDEGVKSLVSAVSLSYPDPNHGDGTAIVTTADRTDIETLKDVKGGVLATSTPTAFTGLLVPYGEMMKQGFKVDGFFSETLYLGDDDAMETAPGHLLDGTAEGVECAADRVFSMQYHPESASGPQDSAYLFKKFTKIMEEHKNA